MARFKRRRSFARRAYAGVRKFGRGARKSGSTENLTSIAIAGGGWGALRNTVVAWAQPITSKIPLGNYADEVAFGTLGYFMAKKGSGMVRSAGKAMLTVEAASVGNQLAGQFTGGSMSTASNNPSFGGWQ